LPRAAISGIGRPTHAPRRDHRNSGLAVGFAGFRQEASRESPATHATGVALFVIGAINLALVGVFAGVYVSGVAFVDYQVGASEMTITVWSARRSCRWEFL
jgi:hypothetical protein